MQHARSAHGTAVSFSFRAFRVLPLVLAATMAAIAAPASAGAGFMAGPTASITQAIPATPSRLEGATLLAASSVQKAQARPAARGSNGLAGTDRNGNGVRDDVEAYIAKLPDSAAQKKVLAIYHRGVVAQMMADKHDPAQVRDAADQMLNSMECLFKTYGEPLLDQRRKKIRELTLNTPERQEVYVAFAAAMNGSVMSTPRHVNCD